MAKSPTILDEMIADIYVNHDDNNSITILHDKAFDDVLLELSYNTNSGELLFRFETKEMAFGEKMLGDFASYFINSKEIVILQMDMETQKPVAGVEVPITITYH